MRYLAILFLIAPLAVLATGFHDGHIHYNKDVWDHLPPDQALEFLAENDIHRTIVSSTPAQGTEMLYRKAPGRIIPFIRPYRTLHDVLTWHHNPEIVGYIKSEASKGIYRGFGEFHMWIEHLDGKSVVPQLMQIAADNQWALSAHTDIETIKALINMQPSVNVIWAHCGFDYPVDGVRLLLETYPTAYCEMSLYKGLTDEDNNLVPAWKTLLEDHADRFMVGIDTYKNGRWGELSTHAELIREWIEQLSPRSAHLVSQGNIERLFPAK